MLTKNWKIILFALFGVGVIFFYKFYYQTSEEPRLVTEAVKVTDLVQLVQVAGVLQPKVKVDVGAQVSGQVRKIHVQLGQQVKKGDVLVSMDPELARNEVAQAEAARAQQAALIEARQADLKLALSEMGRQRRLLVGEATTVAEVERAEVELLKLQADLRGQSASLNSLQAQLDKRRLALSYATITAPIDGVVVSLPVQEGQTVIAVQITPVMVTLANMDEITVRSRVPEAEVAVVRAGQKARFVTLSGEAQSYEGVVRVIQPVPERAGNAVFYNVLFEVDNKARKLLPDMTVQVNIATGEAKGVLTIPTVALGERTDDGRFIVQVVDVKSATQSRKIRIGIQDGAKVQVLEGLKEGEKVLLAPPSAAASLASATAKRPLP